MGLRKYLSPLHTHVWGPGKLKDRNTSLLEPEKGVIGSERRGVWSSLAAGEGTKVPCLQQDFCGTTLARGSEHRPVLGGGGGVGPQFLLWCLAGVE